MEVGPDAICVKVTRLAAKQAPATPDASNQLRVTGMTKPTAIAGAIAGKAREGALVLSVTAIGPAAVLKATKGLAIARSYVKDDGLDIYAAPRFVDIKLPDHEEGTRTGVNLDLFVERK
jgi:stage V sporulation protein S